MNAKNKKLKLKRMNLKKFSLNRTYRIYSEIREIGGTLEPKLNKKDKKIFREKMEKLRKIYKKSMIFYVIRGIAFVLLYISTASYLFGSMLILEWFASTLVVIAGLLGVTILAGIVYLCQTMINLYISDAHLVSDYIIALEIKYS